MANALGISGNALRYRDNALCIGCCTSVVRLCGIYRFIDCDTVIASGDIIPAPLFSYARRTIRASFVVDNTFSSGGITTRTVDTASGFGRDEEFYWTLAATRYRSNGTGWVLDAPAAPTSAQVLAAAPFTGGVFASGPTIRGVADLPQSQPVGTIDYTVAFVGVRKTVQVRTTATQVRSETGQPDDTTTFNDYGGFDPTGPIAIGVGPIETLDLRAPYLANLRVWLSVLSNRRIDNAYALNPVDTPQCLNRTNYVHPPSGLFYERLESTATRTNYDKTIRFYARFRPIQGAVVENDFTHTIAHDFVNQTITTLPQYPLGAPSAEDVLTAYCGFNPFNRLADGAPPVDPRIASLLPENRICRGCGD